MPAVLLFYSTKAFPSEQAFERYLSPAYTEDGEMVASDFMREVALTRYEPMCIETAREERTVRLREFVGGFSYSEQWAHLLPSDVSADTVILVYPPNLVSSPERATKVRFHAALSYAERPR